MISCTTTLVTIYSADTVSSLSLSMNKSTNRSVKIRISTLLPLDDIETYLTETPTSSCFCLQCDTSELNARNSNLFRVESVGRLTQL